MYMDFSAINWLAVLVVTAFNMVLGMLWYGPLFGKYWLKLIGKKRDEIESPGAAYIIPLVAAFISALALALIIESFALQTWWMGALAGALVWIGIGATALATNSVFEERSFGVWVLFCSYQLIVFIAAGILFIIW